MPELPEVELISRSLNTLIRDRTILKARLLRERLTPDSSPNQFARRLRNRRINRIDRRGKHILFDLTGDTTLIVHLRMSGRFSILQAEAELPKFTHATFELDDGTRLVFDDQRHFGLMKVVATQDLYESKELKKLAPEPFSDEFSAVYLYSVLQASRRTVKELLVDQRRVTGLGNIYAAEALFAAGVHPAMPAFKLSRPRTARLHESIRAVLAEAINYASNLAVDPENLEGNYFSGSDDPTWYVYDREGLPCRHCNTLIVRLKQGGRSTYFCKKCQRR